MTPPVERPPVHAGGAFNADNERPAAPPREPLRLCHMKDTNGRNRQKGPGEPEGSPERTTVSYTPQERELIRKGLRIWVRVAIRSYMKRNGLAPDGSHLSKEDGEGGFGADGRRDETGIDPEERHAN